MAANFIVNGDSVTVSFTYTEDVAKTIETVKSCVKNIYEVYSNSGVGNVLFDGEGNLIPHESLNESQLLEVLDTYIIEMIIDKAVKQHEQDRYREAVRMIAETLGAEIAAKFL